MSCIDCRLTYIFNKTHIVCLIKKRTQNGNEKKDKNEENAEKEENFGKVLFIF